MLSYCLPPLADLDLNQAMAAGEVPVGCARGLDNREEDGEWMWRSTCQEGIRHDKGRDIICNCGTVAPLDPP